MKAKLLRLTRWLRGLGTCRDCGGETIKGKCPMCLRFDGAEAKRDALELRMRNYESKGVERAT